MNTQTGCFGTSLRKSALILLYLQVIVHAVKLVLEIRKYEDKMYHALLENMINCSVSFAINWIAMIIYSAAIVKIHRRALPTLTSVIVAILVSDMYTLYELILLNMPEVIWQRWRDEIDLYFSKTINNSSSRDSLFEIYHKIVLCMMYSMYLSYLSLNMYSTWVMYRFKRELKENPTNGVANDHVAQHGFA